MSVPALVNSAMITMIPIRESGFFDRLLRTGYVKSARSRSLCARRRIVFSCEFPTWVSLQSAAFAGMRKVVKRYSNHVPTAVSRRMPRVHVAAIKIFITDVDHSVADAWSRHAKGFAKHRSPLKSNAIYVSVCVVSQVVAEDNDLVSAHTNLRSLFVGPWPPSP